MSSGFDQARCRLPAIRRIPSEGVGVGQLVLAHEDALGGQLGRHRPTHRGEGLDHVRQGVGARARGERRRAAERELRVAHGRVGDEVGAGDAHLADALGIGEHGHGRHLRAGPCRGGQGDDGHHGTGHAELAVVVGRLAAVREDHGHRLGEVEAAAPAHADHDVRVHPGRELGALGHLVHRDVGQHVGERRHVHARVLEQPHAGRRTRACSRSGRRCRPGLGTRGPRSPSPVRVAARLRTGPAAVRAGRRACSWELRKVDDAEETALRGPLWASCTDHFLYDLMWREHGAVEQPLSTGARQLEEGNPRIGRRSDARAGSRAEDGRGRARDRKGQRAARRRGLRHAPRRADVAADRAGLPRHDRRPGARPGRLPDARSETR